MLLLLVIAVLYCCVTGYQIPGLFLTGVARRQRQDCITITHRQLALRSSTSLSVKSWNEPGIFEGEDEEESVTFRTIVKNYLLNKYRNCRESDVGEGIDCRFMCNLTQVSEIVRSVLPPVTQAALQQEVRLTMDKFEGKDVVDSEDFLEAVMSNNYWREAGGLVVKELLFLDCIYAYYHLDGQRWLGDDDYNELKGMLTWEGSSVASMSAKEALFVTAVAASRRGDPLLSDDKYIALKHELQAAGSWVTARQQDSLERLGLQTFLGYLHGSLAAES